MSSLVRRFSWALPVTPAGITHSERVGERVMTTGKFVAVGAMLMGAFASTAWAGNGNGIPSGPRYNLQVIAYDNCPAGDFTDSNRHQIAVKANYQVMSGDLASNQNGAQKSDLLKQNTILLSSSATGDFQVADGNACQPSDGAELVLPTY